MRRKTIVEHKLNNGKTVRWCLKCGVHVNEAGETDPDYYTHTQYMKFMAIPVEQRCTHLSDRPDTREDLLKRIDEVPYLMDSLQEILRDIVKAVKF